LALALCASALTVRDVANAGGCDTAAIKGLSKILVNWTNNLIPGLFTSLVNVPHLSLGEAARAVPYLQSAAADALYEAAKSNGGVLGVNSALRTLPQQLLLYTWYQSSKCGIKIAAKPGQSNHESGIAVDVANPDTWQSSLQKYNWMRLGAHDPPHYDYKGSGIRTIGNKSVLAFQKMWNHYNPTKKIGEDGVYGPNTEAAVFNSPANGW